MPDFFKEWLLTLDAEQADELDNWMDGEPEIRDEVADVLNVAHPGIFD